MKNIYFLSLLILFSCQEKKDNKNIIPKGKFTSILEEIHLKESEFPSNRINNTNYQEILYNHNVSKTDFENTLQYYSERPDLLEKMYEEMLINLEEKRNQLN